MSYIGYKRFVLRELLKGRKSKSRFPEKAAFGNK